MKRHASDWQINILSAEDIDKYNFKLPSVIDKIPLAQKSDIIRLNLLYLYGGVWMDATIFLNTNLNWLLDFTDKYDENEYFQPKLLNFKYFENWFIVVPKKHNLNILKHLNLFNEIIEYYPNHHKTYIYNKNYIKKFFFFNTSEKNKKYFLFYQIFGYLNENDKSFRPPINLQLSICILVH